MKFYPYREVSRMSLPLRKGEAEKVVVMLKGGGGGMQKVSTSGVGVGQCPRHQNFALEIPTCWYILALPNAKICVTPDAKPKICVTPDASQWNIGGVGPSGIGAGVGHVHFIFFV